LNFRRYEMREIKFRAWDKMNGKILKSPEVPIPCMSESDLWILMQYTGLKDKDGKEIYEGDICGYGDKDPSIFLIIWQFNGWAKKYPKWDKSLPYPLIDKCDLEDIGIEIIGNIYENPELLKGLKNGRD